MASDAACVIGQRWSKLQHYTGLLHNYAASVTVLSELMPAYFSLTSTFFTILIWLRVYVYVYVYRRPGTVANFPLKHFVHSFQYTLFCTG